jgi:hypothetical protein
VKSVGPAIEAPIHSRTLRLRGQDGSAQRSLFVHHGLPLFRQQQLKARTELGGVRVGCGGSLGKEHLIVNHF